MTKLQQQMEQAKLCIVIPTYNNDGTLAQVIDDVLAYTDSVIVVNDGSTDRTSQLLEGFKSRIIVVGYARNRGKGYALRCGFEQARKLGYEGVITLDSDGQHRAEDLPLFVAMAATYPGSLLAGERTIDGTQPAGNSFANRFSNFWFALQTGRRLRDTQNGFRLYPLKAMGRLRHCSSRYEAELELLVRVAWRGIAIRPVPVHVYYPPSDQRVSHFRPGVDFFRISVLNAVFTLLAIVYGYPSMLLHKLFSRTYS